MARELAERPFLTLLCRPNLTLDHHLGIRRDLERNGLAAYELDGLAAERPGDLHLIGPKRQWRAGGLDQAWVDAHGDRDRKRLVRRLAVLQHDVGIRAGQQT